MHWKTEVLITVRGASRFVLHFYEESLTFLLLSFNIHGVPDVLEPSEILSAWRPEMNVYQRAE